MARRELSEIEGVLLLGARKFGDARGFFSETHNRRQLASPASRRSSSGQPVALGRGGRGARPAFPEPAARPGQAGARGPGAILDVAVDLRRGSPTHGEHVAVELGGELAPALDPRRASPHGFATLEPNCEICYKVTGLLAPDHDRGQCSGTIPISGSTGRSRRRRRSCRTRTAPSRGLPGSRAPSREGGAKPPGPGRPPGWFVREARPGHRRR